MTYAATRYRLLPQQGDWIDLAACAGHNPNHWYIADRGGSTYNYAREICGGCSVQPDCLDWALRAREEFGVWGGLTPEQRRHLARRKAATA